MVTTLTGSCFSKYSLLGELANQTAQYVKSAQFIQPDCLTRRIQHTCYRVSKLLYPETRVLGKISTRPWLDERCCPNVRKLNVQVKHLKPNLFYASPKMPNDFSDLSSLNFTEDYASDKAFQLARNQKTWSPIFPDVMLLYK